MNMFFLRGVTGSDSIMCVRSLYSDALVATDEAGNERHGTSEGSCLQTK